MKFLKSLLYIYGSAGRLLDFTSCYNRISLERRLEIPGYLRDKNAFLADRNALQKDVNLAKKRIESSYGESNWK